MSRWFRLFDTVLDDPKVQKLPPEIFKGWVNLLCLASRTGGVLPQIGDIAFALRISDDAADSLVIRLCEAKLLDSDSAELKPHKWEEFQYFDKTNAARQKRFRDSKNVSNALHNVTITPVYTEEETDTEVEGKNRVEAHSAAKASPKRGSRLPADWELSPSDGNISMAVAALGSYDRVDAEEAKFKDYWISQPGQKGVKLDWSATWRNWIRRAAEQRPTGKAKPRHGGDSVLEIGARLLAEAKAEERNHEQISSNSGDNNNLVRLSERG